MSTPPLATAAPQGPDAPPMPSPAIDTSSTSTFTPSPIIGEARSEIAALWLQSRRLPSKEIKYRPKGEDRPFTLDNLKIAVRLLQLYSVRFTALFTSGWERRVMALLIGRLMGSFLPTAQIWAYSRMMDMVQKSLEAGAVDRGEVIRVAFVAMVCAVGNDALRYALKENDALVRMHVDDVLERAYLAAQFSLPISATSSPYFSALMHDAGIFAGYTRRPHPRSKGEYDWDFPRSPYGCLHAALDLFTDFLRVLSQICLMYRTVSSGGPRGDGGTGLILIALSLAPTVVRVIINLVRDRTPYFVYRLSYHLAETSIREMADRGESKQEAVLYGLKDWALARWDDVRSKAGAEETERRKDDKDHKFGLKMMDQGVQTCFYVLLALKVLPTNLSLGSIRLYKDTVSSLLESIQALSRQADRIFQLVFYIAAYTEAVQLPENPHHLRPVGMRNVELLNFDKHRLEGGMSIVATNLNFRYPGANKDVLHGINLTILPGTTLAIVGLNGSGKTTLTKALMGLYEHQGSLLLNGRPITAYDPATIHRRTSCLFQDFCRYSFTLRENVGIGNVDQMAEDTALEIAMDRGGALGIKEKVGLEGKLNRYGSGSGEGEDEVKVRGTVMAVDYAAKASIWKRAFKVWRAMRAWYMGGAVECLDNEISTSSATNDVETKPLITVSAVATDASSTNRTTQPVPAAATPATGASRLEPTTETDKAGHTLHMENTASLSGGQWQRVALSRSFMRASEADLVIFDEPSASLDPKAEAQLFDRIHALSRQNGRRCTTIYISHRFSTVRKADQIAVVEDGTITECGPHAELMAKAGRYAELYNIQKAGFEE